MAIRAFAASALFFVASGFLGCFFLLFAPVAHNEEFVAEETHNQCGDSADCLTGEVVNLIQELGLSNGFCAHASGHNRAAEQGLNEYNRDSQNDVHNARNHDVVGAVECLFAVKHEREHLTDDRTYQKADEVRRGGVAENVFQCAEVEAVESLGKYAAAEFEQSGKNQRYDKLRAAADETEKSEDDHLAHVFVGLDFVNEFLEPRGKFDFFFALPSVVSVVSVVCSVTTS